MHEPAREEIESFGAIGGDPGSSAVAELSTEASREGPKQWRAASNQEVRVDVRGVAEQFDLPVLPCEGRLEQHAVGSMCGIREIVSDQVVIDSANDDPRRIAARSGSPGANDGSACKLEQVVDTAAENPGKLKRENGGGHLTTRLDRNDRLA